MTFSSEFVIMKTATACNCKAGQGDVEDVQISICWHNCCKKYVQSFILNLPHIAFRGHRGLLIPQRVDFPRKVQVPGSRKI